MSDAIVVGGGVLGAAIARVAADGGARVTVLSRTPRTHPGMWRRFDARRGQLPARDAAVFVVLAPGPGEDADAVWGELVPEVVRGAWLTGARSVTACVPAGGSRADPAPLQRAGRTTVLRVGPLVAVDEGCAAPWIRALREGNVARIPRGLPELWPLAAEDAARAAWRLAGSGEVRTLRGPERLRVPELATLLTTRFGGRYTERWVGGIEGYRRTLLAAQVHLDDDWDDVRMGPRIPMARWSERLAGPRRKR